MIVAKVWDRGMEGRFLLHRASSSFILATEEVITISVGEKKAPPTARICIFDPPAVLVGYSQDVYEEVNVDEAKKLGFDINRRPTGGGAIVMIRENTPGWELWLPRDYPGLPATIEGLYEYLSNVVIEALKRLGIDARFRPKNDIDVNGRKISGTGLYTYGNGLMFCGTILLDLDVLTMPRVLKIPIEKLSDKTVKDVSKRIITVKEILGYAPSLDRVVEAYRHGLEAVLNLRTEPGDLLPYEKELLNRIEARYRSHEWIYEFRRAEGYNRICTYKTPYGLIRIHLKIVQNVLESIMITGDLFTYPEKALLDLEAYLKHTPIDMVRNEIINFFAERNAKIYGLDAHQLANLITSCIEGKQLSITSSKTSIAIQSTPPQKLYRAMYSSAICIDKVHR